MKVGFTGTQDGLTFTQENLLRHYLQSLYNYFNAQELHHGMCIGADFAAYTIGVKIGYRLVAHQPTNKSKTFLDTASVKLPALPYLTRNQNIVDSTDILVATPNGPEKIRSGTWSTVRYAKKKNVGIVLLYPDGRLESSV